MRIVFCFLLFSSSILYAQNASFASQSDFVADLSDSVLNGIVWHPIESGCGFCKNNCWADGFGCYRERESTPQRRSYQDWFGGLLLGLSFPTTCEADFDFFVAGSGGRIDISEETNFETYSILCGMHYERLCGKNVYGFICAGGFAKLERVVDDVKEEPQGIFLCPELRYAHQYTCFCLNPILRTSLRYAGFFSQDYQHRDIFGTLHVQKRSIQLFTLLGELATPVACGNICFEPYVGLAGRFQFQGNTVKGHLVEDNVSFPDGIYGSLLYGLVGFRACQRVGCMNLQANVEGSYDIDSSWRIIGELNLSYVY